MNNKNILLTLITITSWFGLSFTPASQAQQGNAVPGTENGAEMVITATRVEREVFNTPQAISVIDDRQIEEANLSSTPDLFRFTEGVYVQKTNLGGGAPFIRGLTGKQVLILVDGVRLNNSFYRFGPHQYLNTIDPATIERVEVVRGPASVLYGSDALGGVINIITKKRTDFSQPSDTDGLVRATLDSAVAGTSYDDNQGGYALRLQGEGNQDRFGWFLGGSAKSHDDLEAGGDVGEQVPSAYREYAFDLKLNNELEAGRELLFGLQHLRQNDVPKTSEVTLDGKVQFNYEPQERSLAYLEYSDSRMAAFDDTKFTLSYNRQKEGEEIIAALPVETRELTEIKTLGGSAQFTNGSAGGTHRLTYGLEFYADNYATRKQSIDLDTATITQIDPGVPDGASYDSLGLYLQDEINLGERWNLIAGLRYSQFEAEGILDHPTEGTTTLKLDTDKITGSLQGLVGLTDRLNFVAGIAQGFRAPNMEDFFGRVDFTSEIPNTNLKPEESTNYETGLKYFDRDTFAELFYFYTDYKNLINRVDTVDALNNPVRQRQNVDEATIQGIEASLRHDYSRHWRVGATIAWTRGRDGADEPLRRIPPLNGSLHLRYTHTPSLWFELESLLADNQDELSGGDISDPRIPDGGTPGYGVFILKSGFKRNPQEQMLVSIENIFDKRYKTHGSGLYAAGLSLVVTYGLKLE